MESCGGRRHCVFSQGKKGGILVRLFTEILYLRQTQTERIVDPSTSSGLQTSFFWPSLKTAFISLIKDPKYSSVFVNVGLQGW